MRTNIETKPAIDIENETMKEIETEIEVPTDVETMIVIEETGDATKTEIETEIVITTEPELMTAIDETKMMTVIDETIDMKTKIMIEVVGLNLSEMIKRLSNQL